MGSFHIGGTEVEIKGKNIEKKALIPNGVQVEIDLNGSYQIEKMYVQYFIHTKETIHYPLLFLHGGGLSGACFESTPDSREGWLNFFLKKGWAVYNTDGVDRGRSGWAPYPNFNDEIPYFLPKYEAFERFRFGSQISLKQNNMKDLKAAAFKDTQFPIENYNFFTKQMVPRWSNTFEATLYAYEEL